MKKHDNTRGALLAKFLLMTFRGLFILYSIGLVLYILICSISLGTGNQSQYANLPVVFSFTETGNLISPGIKNAATFKLHNATGIISTDSLTTGTTIFSMVGSVLISICILLIIKLICQILEAAKTNDFLVVKNAIRMRHMALLFIMVFLIDKIKLFVSSSYLADKLEFTGVNFNSVNFYSFANWEYVFFYLFLLVIAEAFRIGAQLKRENDLTI